MALPIGEIELEVVGREITGRPVPGRPRRPYSPYLRGLPALLLASLLLVPILVTTATAVRTPDGLGLGNFTVLGTEQARHAILNSVAWIGVALALVGFGFCVALVGQRVPALWPLLHPVLILPFAVSALVSGAAFRIIFDPAPERGTVSALLGDSPVWLGPGWFWVVLISAFIWTWLGYVTSLFRAGLDAIPDDLVRTVKAEGLRGWRRLLAVELPILRPISGIVTLTLVVAAARVFDLVLITVPGPMQDDASVLALYWWRTSNAMPEPGPSAALALVLFAIVACVALCGMRGLRRSWAMPASTIPQPARSTASPAHRRLGWTMGVLLGLSWLFPTLILVMTAFHTPRAAALHGWWAPAGLGIESFTAASTAGLWQALLSTLVIAGLATVLVRVVAVPMAYLLAWGGLAEWFGKVVVTVLVVLAVTPLPMYAEPLRDLFDLLGLTGSRISLALVHAAAGLPFAVLLLRAAFASAPPSLIAETLRGEVRDSAVLTQVRQTYRPALIAVMVLEFVLVWNDFIVGLLISGPGSTPLSLVLWGEARQFATSAGTVAAAAVVMSVVPVALLLRFWPTVVRGLTVGTKP
ncbi:MAG TPA: ABC transporter permease subunit [Pseudonocardiaceae bacterium]|nr:ABC transporter permease subunit [Pseudonocardiaceae bacterium]